jgi:hypothetical protein
MTSEVLSAPNWQKDFECLCGTGEGGHLSVPVWKWESVRTADANRQLSIPSSHRNAVRASQATARCVAATKAEGKAGMKKAPIVLSEDQMNRPLSRLATRAAYGASQLPRIAWYLGHGLAMTRIAQRARESGSARPRPHTDAPILDRKRFFTDMGALWRQDLANVEAGVYPLPADHDGSLKMLLHRSRLFFEDLPAVRRRRESGDHSEVLTEESRG